MKKVLAIAVIWLAVMAVAGCEKRVADGDAGSTSAASSQGFKVASADIGNSATDFQIKDLKGNTIRLSDHKGKVIILNFFATWCPPCVSEMPDFEEISVEYAKDVKVIAINVAGEPEAKINDFAGRHGLNFSIAAGDGKVSTIYGPIRAIPVTYVIDGNFNIARKYIGARPKSVFEADIKALR